VVAEFVAVVEGAVAERAVCREPVPDGEQGRGDVVGLEQVEQLDAERR